LVVLVVLVVPPRLEPMRLVTTVVPVVPVWHRQ
jgi:hypothetical protein